MADNYLEYQYEAYLARKAQKEKQKKLLFKKQLKAYKERLALEKLEADRNDVNIGSNPNSDMDCNHPIE